MPSAPQAGGVRATAIARAEILRAGSATAETEPGGLKRQLLRGPDGAFTIAFD